MLALFYVLTLMMFEHEMTKSAASHAYWVVVVAGPAVVMRFLTSATFGGWELRCAERCGSWWSSPAPLGVSFLLILLGVSFAITRVGLPDGGPLGRLRDRISAARVAPPAAAFWITLVNAVLSLAVTTGHGEFRTNTFVNYWILAIAFVIPSAFAFGCGSIVGTRTNLRARGRHRAGPRPRTRSRHGQRAG